MHETLYARLIDLIRERYLNSGNTHYCSMRTEILMAAHDLNVEYAVKVGRFNYLN